MNLEAVDLTFIDPHLRSRVMQRISAVEEYLLEPETADAEQLAKRIGLTTSSFYNLVKAWNLSKDPARMQGSGQEGRTTSLTDVQIKLIKYANDRLGDQSIDAVVRAAMADAEEASVQMRSTKSARAAVKRLRTGTARHIPAGVTHVLDHCDLNIPIAAAGHQVPIKATLTALVRVKRPSIIASALYLGAPDPNQLHDIVTAIGEGFAALNETWNILLDAPLTRSWNNMRYEILNNGASVSGEGLPNLAFDRDVGILRKRGNGRSLIALLGDFTSGYRMSVRNGSVRSARMKAGAEPLPLEEAIALVKARIAAADIQDAIRR